MIVKLYLDIYVIIIFIIILLINFITVRILKEKVKISRVLVSSLLVSIIMCTTTVICNQNRLIVAIIGIISLVLNVLSIYSTNKLCKLINDLIYTLISTMLVGISIYTAINIFETMTFIVFIVSFLITYFTILSIKIILDKNLLSEYIFDAKLIIKDNSISVKVLIDTGNLSTFRMQGLSYVEEEKLKNINTNYDELETYVKMKINTVYFAKTINIVIADYILLENYKGGEKIIYNPAIGIVNKKLSKNDEFNMILSPKLLI